MTSVPTYSPGDKFAGEVKNIVQDNLTALREFQKLIKRNKLEWAWDFPCALEESESDRYAFFDTTTERSPIPFDSNLRTIELEVEYDDDFQIIEAMIADGPKEMAPYYRPGDHCFKIDRKNVFEEDPLEHIEYLGRFPRPSNHLATRLRKLQRQIVIMAASMLMLDTGSNEAYSEPAEREWARQQLNFLVEHNPKISVPWIRVRDLFWAWEHRFVRCDGSTRLPQLLAAKIERGISIFREAASLMLDERLRPYCAESTMPFWGSLIWGMMGYTLDFLAQMWEDDMNFEGRMILLNPEDYLGEDVCVFTPRIPDDHRKVKFEVESCGIKRTLPLGKDHKVKSEVESRGIKRSRSEESELSPTSSAASGASSLPENPAGRPAKKQRIKSKLELELFPKDSDDEIEDNNTNAKVEKPSKAIPSRKTKVNFDDDSDDEDPSPPTPTCSAALPKRKLLKNTLVPWCGPNGIHTYEEAKELEKHGGRNSEQYWEDVQRLRAPAAVH